MGIVVYAHTNRWVGLHGEDKSVSSGLVLYVDAACVCYGGHIVRYGGWCEYGERSQTADERDAETTLRYSRSPEGVTRMLRQGEAMARQCECRWGTRFEAYEDGRQEGRGRARGTVARG